MTHFIAHARVVTACFPVALRHGWKGYLTILYKFLVCLFVFSDLFVSLFYLFVCLICFSTQGAMKQ